MGLLVEGRWHDTWYDTKGNEGKFKRQASLFRNEISSNSEFAPESGRYHLYVSLACPWAHRTLIMRELKDLAPHISVSVVNPKMREHGWTFLPYPGATQSDCTYLSDDNILRERATCENHKLIPDY